MQIPDQRPIPGPVSKLAVIIYELSTAGIQPSPLNIIARAVDLGVSDTELNTIVRQLAESRGIEIESLA